VLLRLQADCHLGFVLPLRTMLISVLSLEGSSMRLAQPFLSVSPDTSTSLMLTHPQSSPSDPGPYNPLSVVVNLTMVLLESPAAPTDFFIDGKDVLQIREDAASVGGYLFCCRPSW
jgi:hypothetical protein